VSDAQSSVVSVAAAVLALPHEYAHALPATVAGLPHSVTLLPDWDGRQTPLGRFEADVDAGTSPWLVRLIAVAPFALYVGVAGLVRVTVAPTGLFALGTVVLCSYWAAPSPGDVAVAIDAATACKTGELVAPVTRRRVLLTDGFVAVTTLTVGVVLLS